MGNKAPPFKLKRSKYSRSEQLAKAREMKRKYKESESSNTQNQETERRVTQNSEIDIMCTRTQESNSSDTAEMLTVEIEEAEFQNDKIEGRRIVDFQYFFDQIKTINNHNLAFGCTIENMHIIKEHQSSLHSIFVMRCNMCNAEFKLSSADNIANTMDVNHGIVMGAITTGLGRTNLNEILASVDLPILTQRKYENCHDDLGKLWQTASELSMQEAAKEEAIEAISCGNTKDGIPVITVIADCCWSKRSYKSNYSASSGVAVIIGQKTGKVLYIDVKNKYCSICVRAILQNKSPASHNCTKNHSGSSTSMEQNAIVQGFKSSVATHNLIYGTLIADGDASTYKKILESRPYPNVQVQKIECSNHLLRNYSSKILAITKDTSIPINERRILTADRITRLRTAIRSAARYRRAQNLPQHEQIINLKKDILNGPKHIFGDHSACDQYYCNDERKSEISLIPKIKVLFKKIMTHTTQIALHSKSLLYNLNNNRAEQFNSIVAKHVGGKRINYSLKNSYTTRCHAAVVSFNSGRPQYTIYKARFKKSPGCSLKRLEMARLKRKQERKRQRRLPKRRLFDDKAHYGEECQKPDMSVEEYEMAKDIFLRNLQEQVNNKEEIERDTVLQAESALWLELRRCLLTASSFSKICKRRENISSAPLVKAHLYSYSLDNVPSIRHGKSNEAIAIRQLEKQEHIVIEKCGLFIDEEMFFLGASPDGIFQDGIVEIKCPVSAFGMDPEDAIIEKKIKFWFNGNINRRHDWYYQIQGQLHITKKNICLLAVWTGKEYNLKVEKIIKDDQFWKECMEQKLINFYNKCLLPEIVDPRKYRSMPIRDIRF